MLTVIDDDEEDETTTNPRCGGRPKNIPHDVPLSDTTMTLPAPADVTRQRIVGQSASVDRVRQRRKRRHRVAATTSELSLPRNENEITSCGIDASSHPELDDPGTDITNNPTSLSRAVYGSYEGGSRPWTDNEWCECSSCHSPDVVSLPTTCFITDPVADCSPNGVRGVRSTCKRCAGCANVKLQCLSPTLLDSSGVCSAPTNASSSGLALPIAGAASIAEVPKVRLKVVYYHNRFVAVPVNTPHLPPTVPNRASVQRASATVTSTAVSTSSIEPVNKTSSVSSVPSSILVPIVMPQCPSSSLSGIVPDLGNQRQIDSRQLPNASPDIAADHMQSQRHQQRPAKTWLRRIIDCLEDRDADDDLSKDGGVNRQMRQRSRRRTSEAVNHHSLAFDALVKMINWCFLIIGILLFIGVIGVIVYTSIGKGFH